MASRGQKKPAERNDMKRNKTAPEVDVTLAAATAHYRDEYRARYEQYYLEELAAIRAELAAAGWDARKVADHPRGTCSRSEYKRRADKYHYVQKHFEWVKSSLSRNEPCIVRERPDAVANLKTKAKLDADLAFNGYLFKLAGKIGKEIAAATYTGHLWAGSTLSVECKDGEKQTWTTKCILNRSCLGTLFNQFPTRRHRDKEVA